jgi:hypothetical protein
VRDMREKAAMVTHQALSRRSRGHHPSMEAELAELVELMGP